MSTITKTENAIINSQGQECAVVYAKSATGSTVSNIMPLSLLSAAGVEEYRLSDDGTLFTKQSIESAHANNIALTTIGIGVAISALSAWFINRAYTEHKDRIASYKGNRVLLKTKSHGEMIGLVDVSESDTSWNPMGLTSVVKKLTSFFRKEDKTSGKWVIKMTRDLLCPETGGVILAAGVYPVPHQEVLSISTLSDEMAKRYEAGSDLLVFTGAMSSEEAKVMISEHKKLLEEILAHKGETPSEHVKTASERIKDDVRAGIETGQRIVDKVVGALKKETPEDVVEDVVEDEPATTESASDEVILQLEQRVDDALRRKDEAEKAREAAVEMQAKVIAEANEIADLAMSARETAQEQILKAEEAANERVARARTELLKARRTPEVLTRLSKKELLETALAQGVKVGSKDTVAILIEKIVNQPKPKAKAKAKAKAPAKPKAKAPAKPRKVG